MLAQIKQYTINPDKSKLKSSFEQYSDHSCRACVYKHFQIFDLKSFSYRILDFISKIYPSCRFMLLNIL